MWIFWEKFWKVFLKILKKVFGEYFIKFKKIKNFEECIRKPRGYFEKNLEKSGISFTKVWESLQKILLKKSFEYFEKKKILISEN